MKKLIVTADDFGVFPSINEGVRQAIINGKVNSVACFANHETAITNTIKLYDDLGDKAEMGCHLTISSGKPLTIKDNDAFTINGYFRDFSELNHDAIEKQLPVLKKELEAQVQVFLDAGIPITHLSCHHTTLTTTEPLFKTYLEVASKFKIPIRSVNIKPDKKETTYRLVLKFMLLDDVPLKRRKEIERFGKEINTYLQQFGTKILTPDILESSHYGPLPMRDIWEVSVPRLVDNKRNDLNEFIKRFKNAPFETGELMLHLIKESKETRKEDSKIDYPGVNKKYFDSRRIEFESINGFDFGKYPDIKLSSWTELGSQAEKMA